MLSDKRFIWTITALALIVALAAGLRVWGLLEIPAGPYYDEAANGILAADIAERGYRPIFITSYTGKEVFFFYAVALVMKMLGTNLLALRLTSVLLGTLTVIATFWCVWELFEEERGRGDYDVGLLSLLTAALLATSFWHLGLSRMGLRAIAQPLLQVLTLALLWRGLRHANWWLLIAAGISCGLTGYTYLAARFFPFPLALALLTLLLVDRRQRKLRLVQIVVFVAVAAIAFAPLGWFFFQNPDRFLLRAQQVVIETADEIGTALTLPQAYFKALGMFFVGGSPFPRFNIPGKPIFRPVLAAAFLFGLILTVYHLIVRRHPFSRARGVLLLSWIPFMVLPTALTVADVIPNHLRAAGLLPLVYLFPALALAWLVGRALRWQPRWSKWLPSAVLASVVVLTLIPTIQDYLVHQPQRLDHYEISNGDVADLGQWLDAVDLSEATVYIASKHYRHPTLAFLARDYGTYKWLTGGRTLVVPSQGSALLVVPRSTDYQWADSYLPPTVGLDDSLLASVTLPEIPLGPDGVPSFRIYSLGADHPLTVSQQMEVDFSHVIRLGGYDVLGTPGADGAVDLALNWEVLNPAPSGDYQVFAHLLDAWGMQWGDTLPFQYPSVQWAPGERFLDRIRIKLPPGTPPGEYVLTVGLYSPEADANLTVVRDDGGFGGIVARLPVTLVGMREHSAPGGIRRPMEERLAPDLTLMGVNLDTTSARTREPIFLTLFWRVDSFLDPLTVRLRLGDLILYEGAPVHGTYPTSAWQPGEWVADRYGPHLPLDAPAGEWPLTVEVVGPEAETRSAELGVVTVISPERAFAIPEMKHSVNVALGDSVELLGYDMAVSDDAILDLTLYWRARGEVEEDYTVFIHVLAADGVLVGQMDSMPQEGAYPTTLWAAGEVIADHYRIQLTGDAQGPLSARVGMYRLDTGEQLGEALVELNRD